MLLVDATEIYRSWMMVVIVMSTVAALLMGWKTKRRWSVSRVAEKCERISMTLTPVAALINYSLRFITKDPGDIGVFVATVPVFLILLSGVIQDEHEDG